MKPLTLERRVALWAALVVFLSLLCCGIGATWFLHRQAVGGLDRQLQDVAEQFFEQVRLHGGTELDLRNFHELQEWLPAPSSDNLVQVEREGVAFFRSPRLGEEVLPPLAVGFRMVPFKTGRMREGTFAHNDVTIRVFAPLERVDALTRDLATVLLCGLPLVLGCVVIGARVIARRALDPVRHIADSAEQINSQRLDLRVPVPAGADEVHRLAVVLNATLDRLAESLRRAQRFSADASHELRTPLTVLHSELEALLRSPTLSDDDRAAVADALGGAKRLSAITNSLLLLARADAGRLDLDLETVDLAEVVADCVDDARIMAEPAALTIECELPPAAPIRGDETRLFQIVSNLLDNAVKYNERGGRIRVTLTPNDGQWTLDIANTGPCIAPDHTAHIFDRFYRAEHHARISGHGLGLSLAHELARAHRGTLTLACSDREWTVLRLTLPQSEIAAAPVGVAAGDGI